MNTFQIVILTKEPLRLLKQYCETTNVLFARDLLRNGKQQSGESLDIYLRNLHTLSRECNFVNVTAEEYKKESIRDSFIDGLLSNSIRQRLLENNTLNLNATFDQARTLDSSLFYIGNLENLDLLPFVI